ncbi:MAG: hypothetical protein AUI36_09125 [Cyanobacteria bacterium 13_1_40CM_2_61_4]|nr:MAG: hypothetical protein AUI36_09125 [Cyanobacteria bacterium 13_1_40CM_2_61_4]
MARRVLREAGPYRPHLVALLLLGLLSVPLALLAPFPIKIVVDSVVGSRPLPPALDRLLPDAVARSPASGALLAAGLLLALALLGRLLELITGLLRVQVREGLLLDLRARLLHRAPVDFPAHQSGGGAPDLIRRIQHDAPAVPGFLTESLVPLIVSTGTLAGMIYVTARIDRPLALVMAGIALGLFATAGAVRGRLSDDVTSRGRRWSPSGPSWRRGGRRGRNGASRRWGGTVSAPGFAWPARGVAPGSSPGSPRGRASRSSSSSASATSGREP